ncbi:hypothetical protein ABZV31_04600 [Streptomyces sp. NPDC005202]|uniref:hypothetical protein n=1 Tax=Streptomyces sp. NPDC005202 TaxID=3157021 RepID=UPI0033A6548F
MIGWLTGEVRELIGRVFRTGECLRAAGRLLAQAFLRRSREPLAQAAIGHVTAAESAARQQHRPRTAAEEPENGVVDGCSPWACHAEAEPVQENSEPAS